MEVTLHISTLALLLLAAYSLGVAAVVNHC